MSKNFQLNIENCEESDAQIEKNINLIIPIAIILSIGSGLFLTEINYILKALELKNFIFSIFLAIIYTAASWGNTKVILRACHEQNVSTLSRLIKKTIGRPYSIFFSIILIINNIIIISILLQRISINTHSILSSKKITEIDIFYTSSIATIPLACISSQQSYTKTRIFSVIILIIWAYLYIGGFIEEFSAKSQDKLAIIKNSNGNYSAQASVCLFFYFTSYYQIIPYIYKEVRIKSSMEKILIRSTIILPCFILINFIYYFLELNANLNIARTLCFVAIGACSILIFMISTTENAIALFEKKPENNIESKNFIISSGILYISAVVSFISASIFEWNFLFGIGCSLNVLLGVLVPGIIFNKIAASQESKLKTAILIFDSILSVFLITFGISLVLA